MSKIFNYVIPGDIYYLESTDENEEYGAEEFEYEVDDKDLEEAVIDIVYRNYFNNFDNEKLKKSIEYFISDFDLLDKLVDEFEDELHEYFREKAFESLED